MPTTSSHRTSARRGPISQLFDRLPAVVDGLPASLRNLLEYFKVDLPPDHPVPAWSRLALATAVSIVGSLVADRLLVALAKAMWPATAHYSHFQFADYAKLTIVGVIIACVAWPVVTAISSAPRWLFLRLAVLVTLVLFLPDIWILLQGQPGRAVCMLMAMHIAIAVVTYNALVRLAPVRARVTPARSVVDDPATASTTL